MPGNIFQPFEMFYRIVWWAVCRLLAPRGKKSYKKKNMILVSTTTQSATKFMSSLLSECECSKLHRNNEHKTIHLAYSSLTMTPGLADSWRPFAVFTTNCILLYFQGSPSDRGGVYDFWRWLYSLRVEWEGRGALTSWVGLLCGWLADWVTGCTKWGPRVCR